MTRRRKASEEVPVLEEDPEEAREQFKREIWFSQKRRGTISVSKSAKTGPTPPPAPRPEGTVLL